MGIFKKLFQNRSSDTTSPLEKPEHIQKETTILHIEKALFDADYMWTSLGTLKCKNGAVYLCDGNASIPPSEAQSIGTYKQSAPDTWDVYFGETLIADIHLSSQLIYFSLLGKYNHFKNLYLSDPNYTILASMLKEPAKMTWCAARWSGNNNGYITDYETGNPIGTFEGSAFEAAAAFALWAYDLGENNKYSNYFNAPMM